MKKIELESIKYIQKGQKKQRQKGAIGLNNSVLLVGEIIVWGEGNKVWTDADPYKHSKFH
jgi:hypothetical protein